MTNTGPHSGPDEGNMAKIEVTTTTPTPRPVAPVTSTDCFLITTAPHCPRPWEPLKILGLQWMSGEPWYQTQAADGTLVYVRHAETCVRITDAVRLVYQQK
jgi:hypothetical protein